MVAFHGKQEGILVFCWLLSSIVVLSFSLLFYTITVFFLLFNQLFVHRRNLSKSKHFSSVSYYSVRLNANYRKRVSEEELRCQ